MKVLAGLILSLSVLLGQRVETTVFLPDSLCGLGWVEHMVLNTANDMVYAGNWHTGNVIAVFAPSGQKAARITFDDNGGPLCVAADLNKIYAYDDENRTLSVIDGNTNTVVKQVYVPLDLPYEAWLFYSPVGRKLYCLCYDGQLAVIDATLDVVKKCLWIWEMPHEAALPFYSRAADKLYVPDIWGVTYGIWVVDCRTDTTVAVVGVDFTCDDPRFAANDSSNKVYVQSYSDITVLSGTADTLLTQLLLGTQDEAGICCNPLTNRTHAAYQYVESLDGPGVLVLDGNVDTILATVSLDNYPTCITCSPASNRVYVGLANDTVAVMDGTSNQVVATIDVGRTPQGVTCYDAADDAVFMNVAGDADLVKLDYPSNSVAHAEELGCTPTNIAYAEEQDRLYVFDDYGGFLNILDAATYRIRRSQYLPTGWSGSAVYNRDLGRMYVPMGGSGLAVLDCATDSLLRVIDAPAKAVFYDSARGKLYCAGSASLQVFEADAETLLAELPEVIEARAFCPDPIRGLLYIGGGSYEIYVIDCSSDTIVRVLETHSGHTEFALSDPYDKIYARSDNNGELLVIDCATSQVLKSFRPGGHAIGGVELNPDGTRLYCCSWDEYQPSLVIDCATDSLVAVLDTLSGPAVWSHDGQRIYACVGWHYAGVAVVDAVNNVVTDSIRTGSHPADVLIHPTADRVYVANRNSSSLTVIRDGVGVTERPGSGGPARRLSMPTIVRGVLFLSEAASHKPQAASLLNAAGRKVMELRPGANEVRALSPGVYFVREVAGGKRSAVNVRKVIITR